MLSFHFWLPVLVSLCFWTLIFLLCCLLFRLNGHGSGGEALMFPLLLLGLFSVLTAVVSFFKSEPAQLAEL